MSLLFLKLFFLIVLCDFVGGLSVSQKNINNVLHRYEIVKVNSQSFLTSTEQATLTNRTISAAKTQKRSTNDRKTIGASLNKAHGSILRSKTAKIASRQLLSLRKIETKTASPIKNPKTLLSQHEKVNKKDENIVKNTIGKVKLKGKSGIRNKTTKIESIKLRRKLNGVRNEKRVKQNKKKEIFEEEISKNISGASSKTKTSFPVSQTIINNPFIVEHAATRPPCKMTSLNESLLSLRSLFHVPRVQKVSDCTSSKKKQQRTIGDGVERAEERGQSSVGVIRSLDRGHMELINEYENERSMDIVGVEYVHPEGHHDLSRPSNLQRTIIPPHSWKNASNNFVSATNRLKLRDIRSEGEKTKEKNFEDDFHVKNNKREVDDETFIDYRRALSKSRQARVRVKPEVSKNENLSKIVSEESADKIAFNESKRPTTRLQNSSSQSLVSLRNMGGNSEITDTPWPLVPGPISCDLDFELQPSFVAKLGEFDYVVSVQRQQNPDVPAEHACTGVVYNPRFVVIAPHCLHDLCDNYGLTVTSTDDLCTIDETIEVDYIIEHENYDPDTRKNDIALIKLKSEIHKKPAKFPKDDGALGKLFYAVGFGELMWKSFPTRISKLLQKMPVQRYQHGSTKEAAGTLDITTANLDLTGAFRGDFGGALISPRGEFVGLKSKLVKKSTEYEVYTRVRSFLPWIESMVALHGSW